MTNDLSFIPAANRLKRPQLPGWNLTRCHFQLFDQLITILLQPSIDSNDSKKKKKRGETKIIQSISNIEIVVEVLISTKRMKLMIDAQT